MATFDVVVTASAPVPSSGYSQAIRAGTLVVTSGYLGTYPDGSGVVRDHIDPRAGVAALRAMGYDGWYSFECAVDGEFVPELRRTLAWFRTMVTAVDA